MVDLTLVGPFVVVLILAIILLPAMYLLDLIRRRLNYEKFFPKLIVLFVISYLLCLSVYPFVISPDDLLFEDPFASYVLVLLFLFAIYLIVFNKTKEQK